MKLSIVIPQIFYDIISRILPGMTILAALYAVACPTPVPWDSILQWKCDVDVIKHPGLAALSVLMLAYLLATFLEILSYLPDLILKAAHRSKLDNPRYERIEKIVVNEFNALFPGRDLRKLPNIALMYDILRMQDPESGSRVVKLRSEAHAYRRLIVGWLICAVIALRYFFLPGEWCTAITIELIMVFLLGLSVALYRHRDEQYYWSLANNYLLKFYIFK